MIVTFAVWRYDNSFLDASLTDVPVVFRALCQFLEEPVRGDEALASTPDRRLRAVFILTRHGER